MSEPKDALASPSLRRHFARARIAEAAMDVFSRLGVEATTVEDLLRAAAVARRTFYRHFPNKEAVLEELYRIATGRLLDDMAQAARANADPWAAIRTGLDIYLDFHVTNARLLRALVREAIRPASPLHPQREAFRASLVELLDDAVVATGGKRYDRYVYLGLVGALETLSLELLERGGGAPETKRVRAIMLALLDALARGDIAVPTAR